MFINFKYYNIIKLDIKVHYHEIKYMYLHW